MATIRRVSTPGRPTFRRPKAGGGYGNARPAPKPTQSVGHKGTTLNPGPARGGGSSRARTVLLNHY